MLISDLLSDIDELSQEISVRTGEFAVKPIVGHDGAEWNINAWQVVAKFRFVSGRSFGNGLLISESRASVGEGP